MTKRQSSVKEESALKQYGAVITSTEVMFQKIGESLSASAISASAARDKADMFNVCLSEYANRENKAIRGELVDYCECLKAVEDKKQAALDTMTEKLKPICDRWKAICTEAHASLKTLCTALDKEAKAVRSLEKIKCKEGSKKAVQVATDLAEKQAELAKKTAELGALMQQFHTQKLGDLKLILSTYSHTQMLSHARALEFYTRSYQDMVDISVEEYVETALNETMPMVNSQSTPALATPDRSTDQLNVTK